MSSAGRGNKENIFLMKLLGNPSDDRSAARDHDTSGQRRRCGACDGVEGRRVVLDNSCCEKSHKQPMQRSQDDATVGYVFQRSHIQQHDAEYVTHFAQKQQTRWASGDDHTLDVSFFSALNFFTILPIKDCT